jgi:hypothetical protein
MTKTAEAELAEAAWAAEIERRVRAREAGTEKLETWEEVKSRLERDVLGC